MQNSVICLSDYDLEWFCYDEKGNIAVLFSNATPAILPKSLIYYEYLYKYFYKNFSVDEQVSRVYQELKFFNELGIYVYDADTYTDEVGKYTRCNQPKVLLNISQLPTDVMNRLGSFKGLFVEQITIPLLEDTTDLAKLAEIK